MGTDKLTRTDSEIAQLQTQAELLAGRFCGEVFGVLDINSNEKGKIFAETVKAIIEILSQEVGASALLKATHDLKTRIDVMNVSKIAPDGFAGFVQAQAMTEEVPQVAGKEILEVETEVSEKTEVTVFLEDMVNKLKSINSNDFSNEDKILIKNIYFSTISTIRTLDEEKKNNRFAYSKIGKKMHKMRLFDDPVQAKRFVYNMTWNGNTTGRMTNPKAEKLLNFLLEMFNEDKEINWKKIFLEEGFKNEKFLKKFKEEFGKIKGLS